MCGRWGRGGGGSVQRARKYNSGMAVIHISEEEAARDLPGLLTKAQAGDDVCIEGALGTFALIPTGVRDHERPKLLSEILADLRLDDSTALLPQGFGDAVEQGIRDHEGESIGEMWDRF